jgi:hypothetical protein
MAEFYSAVDNADSVGAVAGQLAGARYGLTGIPQNWLDVLLHRVRIETIGRELFDASTGETGGRGCQGQSLTLNPKMEEKL